MKATIFLTALLLMTVSATAALTFDAAAPLTAQADDAPHINAPRIFGVRPGSPFLFRVPVSGSRPLTVSAQGLPEGLSLDPKTGILTGTIALREKKTYTVAFTATNSAGTDRNTLRIVVGDRIALTPPMGWNSWYAFAHKVTEKDMRRAADLFEKLGLVNFGWSYINMDDGWQGFRGGSTKAIQANEKFPDIVGMVDHIHSKGLHAGLYTVPMIGSYAGFVGSSCDNAEGEYTGLPEDTRENPSQIYGLAPGIINFRVKRVGPHWFFDRDIAQMSDWGFDFIKFDWTIEPVTARRASKDVAAQKRDIVLSLSNSAKLADGKTLSQCAQMWRTAGDIEDKWASVIGVAQKQFRWAPHAGPGHWNDADMLQFGFIHDAFNQKTPARPSRLSFEEQRSQISLWCLLAAPLLISCDLEKIDAKALSLVTNPEVLEVDQDALGKPAYQVGKGGALLVLRKEMEDGTLALGVFNTGNKAFSGKLLPQDLGAPAAAVLRDLWARRDLPAGEAAFELPPHGCALLRTHRACLGNAAK